MSSKLAFFTAQSEIFSNARQPKTSPNLIFSSVKLTHFGTFRNLYKDFNIKWTPLKYFLCNLPSIIVSVQFLTHEFLNTLILDLFCVIEKEFFDQNARTGYRGKWGGWLAGKQADCPAGSRTVCTRSKGGDGGNTLNAPRTVHSFVREMSSLMLHLSTSVHDGNIVPRWWPSWCGGGQRVHDYWTDAKRN